MNDAEAGRAINGSRVRGMGRVFVFYLALTLLLAYPLTLHPARHVVADDPDTHLFMWTLAWDTYAFVHRPLSMFDANVYHPQRRTLAYSENLIGSALFAAPILWLTDNPVLALNLVALCSSVLCGLGAYVLARHVGMGPLGATLAGLIFAFSPARFFRIGQLHLTTVQWIPFTLAFLHAYLDGGRKRDLRLAAGFFTLQAVTSGHGAVFAGVSIVWLLVYRAVLGEPPRLLQRLRDLGAPGALLLAPGVLIFLPYRTVQVEMGLTRSLDHWTPTPESFLASPARLHAFVLSLVPDAQINQTASAFLFPGYLPLLLAVVACSWRGAGLASRVSAGLTTRWTHGAVVLEIAALTSLAIAVIVTAGRPIRLRVGDTLLFSARDPQRAWTICAISTALRIALARHAPFDLSRRLRRWIEAFRRWRAARRRDATTFYGLLTLGSVWLSAGPPIGLWPLVYWWPGLNFIRVPSRFMVLAVLGLAVLAGIGFERLSARLTPKRRVLLATVVGTLLVAEFWAAPLSTVPYRVEIPAVDRWLARQPTPFVVAELPVTLADRFHSTYMLHSMAHWQKTVHGHSGLRPPLHERLYARLRSFPDQESLQSLSELGVDYLVVHTDFYPPGEWAKVEARIKRFQSWLRLEYVEDAGRVYSLVRPRSTRGGHPKRLPLSSAMAIGRRALDFAAP